MISLAKVKERPGVSTSTVLSSLPRPIPPVRRRSPVTGVPSSTWPPAAVTSAAKDRAIAG